jgi:hypothetical protein
MKMNHIYFHIFTLFFVSSSNILFTTFDFHQEDFNQKKYIELKQKEFLKKYQQLKKQLLESFKVHQNDPELEKELEEEGCKKLQPSMKDEQEKKDANQHFLDTNQSKPFIHITFKSNENGPIQSRFAIEATIIGIGKAIIGWIGLGGAAAGTGAATAAATEAAIIAGVTKAGAVVGGAFIAGSAIKNGIEKLSENNGNKNQPSQEQKAQELKKGQELKEQVNKLHRIESLEKTNPVQAQKEKEELRALLVLMLKKKTKNL